MNDMFLSTSSNVYASVVSLKAALCNFPSKIKNL